MVQRLLGLLPLGIEGIDLGLLVVCLFGKFCGFYVVRCYHWRSEFLIYVFKLLLSGSYALLRSADSARRPVQYTLAFLLGLVAVGLFRLWGGGFS